MIRETELNLFVPSPELLVRLASGEKPLGVPAGPPRIKVLRETFFDTPDQALRRRGMTCKLRQVEGEEPSVVVTVGEGPDLEGITSRSRLTAAAIGMGVFETLRGDSEPATQIQKFVEPNLLRPQLALDIQRLGRVHRSGVLRRPVLLMFFDRITVQVGGTSTVFHEIRIRRRRKGGPEIRDLAQLLRDEHHIFPDGLNTLQRAHRILAMEGKTGDSGLSPYALTLALSVFKEGGIGLREANGKLLIPTFRGSGEDAARALSVDLTGSTELPLLRLGTTEPREGRAMVEVWAIPDQALSDQGVDGSPQLSWYPWHDLLEHIGVGDLTDGTLISTLLLLTRRRLLGQLGWLPEYSPGEGSEPPPGDEPDSGEGLSPELGILKGLLPLLRAAEDRSRGLNERIMAASELSRSLTALFMEKVTAAKGRILSDIPDNDRPSPVKEVDLVSIRVRGIMDRLYQCYAGELAPGLEAAGVHVRPWSGIMNADRRAILEDFSERHLPSMAVASEWGPSFIPDMPPEGRAVGVLARDPEADRTRFFHIVLGPETPAFLPVPGSSTILPLEEVIRGFFLTRHPELERADTFLFHFTAGEATVRELVPPPEPEEGIDLHPDEVEEVLARSHTTLDPHAGGVEAGPPSPTREAPAAEPEYVDALHSVVVRVIAHQEMPESYQAQLLRALERQVSLSNPLIGWSDLYPVTGPLDLSDLDRMLELVEE